MLQFNSHTSLCPFVMSLTSDATREQQIFLVSAFQITDNTVLWPARGYHWPSGELVKLPLASMNLKLILTPSSSSI